MNTIDFTVRGTPVPQPRPRGRIAGPRLKPFVQIYDPGDADQWKMRIIRAAAEHLPPRPWDHPIELELTFWLPRPDYLLEPKAPSNAIACPSRSGGDADNLAKPVMDALTNIEAKIGDDGKVTREPRRGIWVDDARVVLLIVRKFYHAKGAAPGARIIATHLTDQLTFEDHKHDGAALTVGP